ncbi:MAG: hypothetical protein IT573_01235, partial [Deltaproteobacteria bacterium]|nr:hypothetical protein [Deltaproteobacteria bacterium]
RAEALELFGKGIQVLEGIAASLPEEYRSRYLNQRFQKKLFEDREKEKGAAKGGFFSRLKRALPLTG